MLPVAAKHDEVPMVRAMGLQQTLRNMAMFIGRVSAGSLIAVLSESITLMIASILFLVAILLVASLEGPRLVHERPITVRQAYAGTREAVNFIVDEPLLGPMQMARAMRLSCFPSPR